MNQNPQVLERIKNNYPKNKHRGRLKLPAYQFYSLSGNTVRIYLKEGVESGNMQEDASAFEGWAIVIRHWGGFDKVELCWEKGKSIDSGHYQRFLYRVKKFSQLNHVWFSVCPESLTYIDDLKIKPNGDYVLNAPIAGRNSGKKPHHKEAILEDRFANGDLKQKLINITDAECINRQLPVGVFEGSISKNNSIFTKGKSAIDLWGISKTNDLLVFELKAEGNKKVGIISELFFYVCVLQDIITGKFRHEKGSQNLSQIQKAKRIKAYFLAPDFHPLINEDIINYLNNMTPKLVEYHFISINKNGSLKLEY